MEGTITAVREDKGYGFVASPGRPEFFWHMNDLNGLEFSDRLIGQRVVFEAFEAAKGWRARDVRAAT